MVTLLAHFTANLIVTLKHMEQGQISLEKPEILLRQIQGPEGTAKKNVLAFMNYLFLSQKTLQLT